MSMKVLISALALLAAVVPAAAVATENDDYAAVGDKEVIALDPNASYVILQTNSDSSMFSFGLTLLRRPTEEDRADYIRRRGEALVKAREKWERKHKDWAANAAAWDKAKDGQRPKKRPVEPVEPTDANLAFAPIDRENMVQVGPFDRFAKKDGRSTFVHKVKPGRYVFYGPIIFTANGAGGTCMCMGSIEFEVPEKTIVHAGMMALNWMDERAKAKAEGRPVPKTDLDLPPEMNAVSWELPRAGASIDPRLAAYRIVPAEMRAAGPFPNYFGVGVDRITAIPGVIAYQRDRIIAGN